jgi:hypothetical protein
MWYTFTNVSVEPAPDIFREKNVVKRGVSCLEKGRR